MSKYNEKQVLDHLDHCSVAKEFGSCACLLNEVLEKKPSFVRRLINKLK